MSSAAQGPGSAADLPFLPLAATPPLNLATSPPPGAIETSTGMLRPPAAATTPPPSVASPSTHERFPRCAVPPGAPLLCRDLRSKKLLLTSRPARDSADVFDAANCCWCARTQTLLGPDRDPSHPDDCRPGRACYRSPLPG